MTGRPSFDELVGAEPIGTERERLRVAHELLVQAGPPPELTPELERGPSFERIDARERRRVKRRTVLVLAAAIAAGALFAAGYAVGTTRGNGSGAGPAPQAQLSLRGTPAAPRARATLVVWPARGGNWPMTLDVSGLPRLAAHAYYEVYLVRGGRAWESCGTFVVASAAKALSVTLNAPFSLRPGDSWIVTRQAPGSSAPGPTVLRPA